MSRTSSCDSSITVHLLDSVFETSAKIPEKSSFAFFSERLASILQDRRLNRSMTGSIPLSWNILREEILGEGEVTLPLDRVEQLLLVAEQRAVHYAGSNSKLTTRKTSGNVQEAALDINLLELLKSTLDSIDSSIFDEFENSENVLEENIAKATINEPTIKEKEQEEMDNSEKSRQNSELEMLNSVDGEKVEEEAWQTSGTVAQQPAEPGRQRRSDTAVTFYTESGVFLVFPQIPSLAGRLVARPMELVQQCRSLVSHRIASTTKKLIRAEKLFNQKKKNQLQKEVSQELKLGFVQAEMLELVCRSAGVAQQELTSLLLSLGLAVSLEEGALFIPSIITATNTVSIKHTVQNMSKLNIEYLFWLLLD